MELTPRELDEDFDELSPRALDETSRPSRSGRRRVLPMLVLAGVLGALGVIVFMALDEAATYFYNADEAVERRESLGDSQFRMQGMVLQGAEPTGDGVAFQVVHDCVVVEVRHSGDLPQLFQPGESAVIEGRWHSSGGYVDADEILIAHDADYQAEDEYEDRVEEAEEAEVSGAYNLDDCPDLDPAELSLGAEGAEVVAE